MTRARDSPPDVFNRNCHLPSDTLQSFLMVSIAFILTWRARTVFGTSASGMLRISVLPTSYLVRSTPPRASKAFIR